MLEVNSVKLNYNNQYEHQFYQKREDYSQEDKKVHCLLILQGLLVFCAIASAIVFTALAITINPLFAIAVPGPIILATLGIYLATHGQENTNQIEPNRRPRPEKFPRISNPPKMPELAKYSSPENWRKACMSRGFLDRNAPPLGKDINLWKQLCTESGFLVESPRLLYSTPLKVPVSLLTEENFAEWKAFCIAAEFIKKEAPDLNGLNLNDWVAANVPKEPPKRKLFTNWGYSPPAPQAYIEGQPIGLPNFVNDCWLNATLQILMNAPEYLEIIDNGIFDEEFAQFRRFKELYQEAETSQTSVLRNGNARAIREWLRVQNTIDRDFSAYSQEDPFTAFFEYFLKTANSQLPIHEQIGDGPFKAMPEVPWMYFHLNMEQERFSFDACLNDFLNGMTDEGVFKTKRFSEAPKNLLIQVRRSHMILVDVPVVRLNRNNNKGQKQTKEAINPPNNTSTSTPATTVQTVEPPNFNGPIDMPKAFGFPSSTFFESFRNLLSPPTSSPPATEQRAEFHKITAPVEMPTEFTLPDSAFLESAVIDNPNYVCTGFFQHIGTSYRGGHYIAFVFKNGQWWKCNDSRVTPIDAALIAAEMSKSDGFYYTKKEPAPL